MDEVKIVPLFPTPVVIINIDRDFTKDEADCISSIPIQKEEKRGMTNHRSKDLYLFDNFVEGLYEIQKFCENHLKQYMEHIEGVDTELVSLRITQSWLNNTKPGESHHMHSHANSHISGVFYISCLPNDNIVLSNRSYGLYDNIEFSIKESTEWNANVITVNVKEGDLLLFPSWVPHNVGVNNTDKERISLSFDTFPIGELGNYGAATHLKL